MRYTTIIDISEIPSVYRNPNARALYLHMALKAGWHDVDRDILDLSIRRLAAQTDLSISATRHALALLERAGLITRQGSAWVIKKWLAEQAVTARPKTAKQQQAIEERARLRQEQEQRERQLAIDKAQRENLAAQGKTSFMLYYENIKKRAEAGDIEAQRLEARHRRTYEAHLKQNSK